MFNKKLAAILMLVVFTVTMAAPGFAKPDDKFYGGVSAKGQLKKGFYDVGKEFDWVKVDIDKMNAKGILTGYPGGIFQPQKPVTHLEAIIMALRVMGIEEKAKDINIPEKVKGVKMQWEAGENYIALALENGILTEKELEDFKPNTPAKRYEVAKYVVRALEKQKEAESHMKEKLEFNDVSAIPGDSVGYIYVAVKMGLFKGYPGNVFQPKKPITRAEMAKIVCKLTEEIEDEDENILVGFVRDIDCKKLTITVKNGYGKKTYDVVEDVSVYIEYKDVYGTLKDVKVDDNVQLILNKEGKVVFIHLLEDREEITNQAEGFVVSVGEDTIWLLDIDDEDEGFVGILKESNIEGKHYELETDYGRFVLVGETDGLEDYVEHKIVVIGEVKSEASIYMRGKLLDVEKFYSIRYRDITQFKVDKDTKVTLDGKKAELDDIRESDFAEVEAKDKVALKIKVNSLEELLKDQDEDVDKDKKNDRDKKKEDVDGKYKGKIVSITKANLQNKLVLDIEIDDEEHTFVIDKDVKLVVDKKLELDIKKLGDITVGMKVSIEVKGGKVVEIRLKD